MRRKPPDIDFSQEAAAELEAIRAKIGQQVPLTLRYSLGSRTNLVSIDAGTQSVSALNITAAEAWLCVIAG